MWAVVTIPEREELADGLMSRLPQPVLKILDRRRNLQANHVRAWQEACEAFTGDWVGVIQEDVLLCDDFGRKVRRRLEEAGRLGYQAVSLFNSRKSSPCLETVHERWGRIDLARMPDIHAEDGSGQTVKAALPGEQCVLMRRDLARHYPRFADRHRDLYARFPRLHDALLGLFVNSHLSGRPIDRIEENHVYVALPNLCDHRIEIPSSIGHSDNDPRRASATWSPGAA